MMDKNAVYKQLLKKVGDSAHSAQGDSFRAKFAPKTDHKLAPVEEKVEAQGPEADALEGVTPPEAKNDDQASQLDRELIAKVLALLGKK